MDYNDLEPQTLTNALLKPQLCRQKHEVIAEIVEWNNNLQPSLAITRRKITNFLQQKGYEDRLMHSAKICVQVIQVLHAGKCPRNFIRAYMAALKQNFSKIQKILNVQYIRQRWMDIPIDILQPYMQTFNLKGVITAEQYDKKFQMLLQKKLYQGCFQLIKIGDLKGKHSNLLIDRMTTNKQASKAADYIKQLKLNPKDFPGIGQRLYKTTARHFLGSNGWQYAEQIFQQHPQALASVIQDMIYKKKFRQAFSILKRNQIREFIHKPETIQALNKWETKQQNKLKQLPSNFLHADNFGPSKPQNFLSLKQLGIQQQDVFWINSKTQNLKQMMLQIKQAEVLGVDTESIVGQTKLQKKGLQSAALIQIATHKRIFLIDGLDADHPLIRQAIIHSMQGETLIVGHSLVNDIDTLFRAVNINEKVKVKNVVDVWKIFKQIFPDRKYSSLAYICKSMLGKEICKQQTLTNWRRRPLRRNQIHYAAMDAYAVIKVYQKMMESYGQMIRYYLEMEQEQI